MNSLLDKTISVRQIWRWTRWTVYAAILIYIAAVLVHEWNLEMGHLDHKDSPYRSLIPVECRESAEWVGDHGLGGRLLERAFFLTPSTRIFSLPESEKKLGFGMRGLPCMGYDFLMVLHGLDFSRVNKFVNENGEVVATVTVEVLKPYRPPVPPDVWRTLPDWPELGISPSNSASLVPISKRSVK